MKCQHDIISLGAGVQSSFALLAAASGEMDYMPQRAIFCDTQTEPKKVYRHLEFLQDTVNHIIPITIVTAGNLVKDALTASKRFASMPLFVFGKDGKQAMIRRQCTNEYKIAPFQKEVAKIIRKQYHKNKVRKWLGISTDEAIRMRLSDTKYIENYYPIIEKRMSRFDCIAWFIAKGYPIPPKSSCIVCPFHSDSFWQDMKDNEPEEFEEACLFDEAIRWSMTRFTLKSPAFLHRSMKPLRDVDFKKGYHNNLFTNMECTGSCFN
jgi:hypothetical protein